MRHLERRAYSWEIKEGISNNNFIEFPQWNLIAVLEPEVKIVSSRNHSKIEATSIYRRGDVLHIIFRKPTDWEQNLWGNLSDEERNVLGLISPNGHRILVPIAEKIRGGLLPAIRQRIRHIPAKLIELSGKKFNIPSNAKILVEQAKIINNNLALLLSSDPPSIEALRMIEEEINIVHGDKFWDSAAQVASNLKDTLEERKRSYEIAINSFNLGMIWFRLYKETLQKFISAYERLGKLGMLINDFEPSSEMIWPDSHIIKEINGIYSYLSSADGSYFDPFSDKIHSREFQALKKVSELEKKENPQLSLKNIILNVLLKLENVVKGAIVSNEEIKAWKSKLSMKT